MKNILYFIVGLILLPFIWVSRAINYVKEIGENTIENYKFQKRMKKFLKENAE